MYLIEQMKESGHNVEEWGSEKKIILLAAPTGCGKTTFAQRYLPDICLKHDTKMAIIVNRRVLKSQVDKQNSELMLENCLVESPVRIFTYQQLENDGYATENIMKTLIGCEFVVLDEAHFFLTDARFNPAAEKTFIRLLGLLGKTCLIFMTATPGGLKPLLDQSLMVMNQSRMEEWEKRKAQLEERRDAFIYGDRESEFISLSKIMKLGDRFKETYEYRSGEFEVEAPPEPYVYEEVGENIPDYGYVSLNFYNSNEELLDLINQSGQSEKWLIFKNSKKEGRKLEKELQKVFSAEDGKGRTVCFVSADYEKYEKMRKIVNEIIKKESYSCSVLIATSVLDNGITISDHRVKNIVVSAFTETEFKQMLGRRRVQEGESINLYVYQGKLSYFRKFQNKYFERFIETLPILAQNAYIINSLILEHRISWDAVERFTYQCNGKRKFSMLSYYTLSREYLQAKFIIQLLERDPEAYLKLVCEWLGKDFVSEAKLNRQVTKEEAYTGIAELLAGCSEFMTKLQYDGIVKDINEKFGVKLGKTPQSVNEFLRIHMSTSQYGLKTILLAKKTFYYLKKGENFPYRMCQEIQNVKDLQTVLKEEKFDASKLFERLFGKNIPDIFDPTQQIAFLTFCTQNTKGFEEIAFRRSGGSISIY